MKDKIILVGGGGHCKACIDVIEQAGIFDIAWVLENKRTTEQMYDQFFHDFGILFSRFRVFNGYPKIRKIKPEAQIKSKKTRPFPVELSAIIIHEKRGLVR